jgi:hypothetical protein
MKDVINTEKKKNSNEIDQLVESMIKGDQENEKFLDF